MFRVRARLMLGLAVCAASGASVALAQEPPLVAGVDGTFAPHVMPKLGGGLEGFNVDLLEAIARQLGRPVEVFAGEFSGLIPAMNAGKIDFVGAPTTVTPERARNLLFTEGYLETYYQFVVPADAPDIRRLEDLRGKTIAVNKGSAYDRWAREHAAAHGFRVEAYGLNTDAVQAVLSGRADANLAGNTVAAYAVVRNKRRLKLATYRIDEGLVWAAVFAKDAVRLRNTVEEALECLKLDGTIAELAERWFGVAPEPNSASVTVFPGYGVPQMAGHDPTPHHPTCR